MPEPDTTLIDHDLEERMNLAQKAVSMVLALRRKVGIKVRQPLSRMLVPVISENVRRQLEQVRPVILSEVNVKEMEFISDTTGIITKKIKPNFKTLGKVYGKNMKELAAAFAGFSQEEITRIQNAATLGQPYVFEAPFGQVTLNPEDSFITSEDMPGWLVASEGALTAALDINITEDLKNEGVARELINRIQNIRKDSGFALTDKVKVTIFADESTYEEISSSLVKFGEYVCSQTLALAIGLERADGAEVAGTVQTEWDDTTLGLKVEKAD